MKKVLLGTAVSAALVLGTASVSAAEMPELAKKSGCTACHAIDHKVVGPAWMDVSKKYKGDGGARDALIKKVHTGGKGNWTSVTGGVPMPPYSPRVSDENIEKLVDFVLGLAG
ncbi:MAG: cytochrome C [Gammaproteobacteria bacterium]|nr:MAG: cytochrome C [Gammaproteobacteria bacterium]